MKKTTIAMIIIAISALVLLISSIIYEVRHAESNQIVYITGGDRLTSRNVTAQPNIMFDNPGHNIILDRFIGYKIKQCDTISTPQLIYPIEFEGYIITVSNGDTLKISLTAGQEATGSNYIFKSAQPITLLVPKMPQSVVSKFSYSLNICDARSARTSLSGNNRTTLSNCRIDSLYLNNCYLHLTDSTTVSEIIIPGLRYNIWCKADSTSSFDNVIVSKSENNRAVLQLNTDKEVNIRYLPSGKQTLDINI